MPSGPAECRESSGRRLKTYAEQGGEQLTEIFLHSRSTINEEEFAGYKDACPDGVKIVGVRVRTDFNGVKCFVLESGPSYEAPSGS